jgi:hypothetical protein
MRAYLFSLGRGMDAPVNRAGTKSLLRYAYKYGYVTMQGRKMNNLRDEDFAAIEGAWDKDGESEDEE